MYRLMDLLSNSTIAYKEIYFDNNEKLLGHESAFVKLLSISNKQLMMPYLFSYYVESSVQSVHTGNGLQFCKILSLPSELALQHIIR